MTETAIKISGIKKMYRLGQFGSGSLKEDLQSWWALKRGKEDPNRKIGDKRLSGKTFMALNGIDLEIRQGERVGIIGPNGAGKSTLLKLLCQVTAPTEGEIELFGRITSMLEVGTGFNGEMTGRENIYQNGAILGMSRKEIDRMIEEIIDFSGVRDFIDTPVKRYSSGMYIKLGFAIASHLESEIVIMDEILAVGDMDFQKKCIKQMRLLAAEDKRTILYVSHNMHTVRELCDRVIVLDEGKIIFDGEVERGIETYLRIKEKDPQFHYDFSQISSHRKDPSTTECKLTSLDLLKKDSLIYRTGEPLRFKIDVLARRSFPDMAIRFVLSSADAVIGAIPLCSLGEFCENEKKSFEVSFDTKLLMTGKYILSIALTDNQKDKIMENCDFIAEACQFEIAPSADFPWKSSGWGHIRLTDPEISLQGRCQDGRLLNSVETVVSSS